MSRLIAEPTGCNDVAELIPPALRHRHQMLGRTPITLHCRDPDAPTSRKLLRIATPHWEVTIEAASGLIVVSMPSKVTNLIAHGDSNWIVEPRITRDGVSKGELGTDSYPAAANQCCQCNIAAKSFVAWRRTIGKYQVRFRRFVGET